MGLLRAGHDAPVPPGVSTLGGEGSAAPTGLAPETILRGNVLRSLARGGDPSGEYRLAAAPLPPRRPISVRARSTSSGILRGGLLPRGGPRLRLCFSTPFA